MTVSVHCPRCHSDEIYRHGLSPTKRKRFRCQCCRRVFQLTYRYEARKPGVKEQIVDMAFNGLLFNARLSRFIVVGKLEYTATALTPEAFALSWTKAMSINFI
ncbi:hypothetical protein CE195_00510 [Sodalis-like symbiont of Philaenus spumarius]|nr:hypothetical protein CE195_00510 [Sodalis-like symbiont of Philaenus spumarius]